ncbi:integrase core domain-containing protein [Rhodococcus sp. WAY2]|uniref:integrase core domain-containing protein n=1 Tax=Rhodococcus sp. WAY2 TaxID=2663121 RepID=UPI00191718A9
MRFGEPLFLQGLLPSIGSVADAFDNALAETAVGLYKAECIADDSPFHIGPLRTVSDVEESTSAWVHWYNTDRLMHRLGRIPPTEYEDRHYAAHRADQPVAHESHCVHRTRDGSHSFAVADAENTARDVTLHGSSCRPAPLESGDRSSAVIAALGQHWSLTFDTHLKWIQNAGYGYSG